MEKGRNDKIFKTYRKSYRNIFNYKDQLIFSGLINGGSRTINVFLSNEA